MKTLTTLVVALTLAPGALSLAQFNAPLTRAQVRAMASQCALKVHPDTIEAIIRQESAYHPYALSINHPATEAQRQGYPDGLYQLAQQPRTRREAIAWAKWLLRHGHTVSIGLMQVNTEVAPALGIETPCRSSIRASISRLEPRSCGVPMLASLTHCRVSQTLLRSIIPAPLRLEPATATQQVSSRKHRRLRNTSRSSFPRNHPRDRSSSRIPFLSSDKKVSSSTNQSGKLAMHGVAERNGLLP